MNNIQALLKREFLESKISFLYTPLAIVGLVFILTLIGDLRSEGNGLEFIMRIDNNAPDKNVLKNVVLGMLQGPVLLLTFFLFGMGLAYCLNSLYEDRKDKSILFWKSLPVSDMATVMSKAASVVLVIPIFYFLVSSIFQIIILIYMAMKSWIAGYSGFEVMSQHNIFAIWFHNLMGLIIGSLWMLPFWSWIMLTSAWAKKSGFLFTLLPVGVIAYVEHWIFDTGYFIGMLGTHLKNGFFICNSYIADFEKSPRMLEDLNMERILPWSEVFGQSDFWIGMLVSAVFLTGAIYTRRIKNEL